MTQRTRSVSPQLRAVGAQFRIFDVFLDVIASGFSTDAACVHPSVQTAILAESDEVDGWRESATQRTLKARGWRDAEGIYDAAGIPEKHRRVLELAIVGDPRRRGQGRRREDLEGGLTNGEIAGLTGHSERTVERWIYDDLPRLFELGELGMAV